MSYEFTKQVSWSIGAISFINSARGNSRHDPLVESALTITPSHRVKLTVYGLAGPRPGATGTTGGNVLLAGGTGCSWPGSCETISVSFDTMRRSNRQRRLN